LGYLQNLTIVEADILQVQLDALLTALPSVATNQPPSGRNQPTNLPSAVTNQPPAVTNQPPSGRIQPTIHPSFKIVANLPYYITSAVLRHVLEATPRPERMVVTVQKEVAERIVATPGQMSLLAVSVQFYGRPTLVHRIPAGAFYPPPKVDSAVVRIDTWPQPAIPVQDVDHFFRIVKAGFGQKRKQLKNSLAAGLNQPVEEIVSALAQAQLDPTRRAETLSLAEWGRLAEVIRR
jgi:16S rRNA (adenine1518-N6/adenine1519-N6)-dimethyltransferase